MEAIWIVSAKSIIYLLATLNSQDVEQWLLCQETNPLKDAWGLTKSASLS